jgi:hypothetical protein
MGWDPGSRIRGVKQAPPGSRGSNRQHRDPGGQTGTTGIPGVKQPPDPGSWIRIRNTGFQPGQAKRRSASKFYIKNVYAYFPATGPYFGSGNKYIWYRYLKEDVVMSSYYFFFYAYTVHLTIIRWHNGGNWHEKHRDWASRQ